MTQRRGFKRALSFICALCLMFSMLGSGPLAAIAEELEGAEATAGQIPLQDEANPAAEEARSAGSEEAEGGATATSLDDDAEPEGTDASEAVEEMQADEGVDTASDSDEGSDGAVTEDDKAPVAVTGAPVLRAPALRAGAPKVVDAKITNFEIQSLSYSTLTSVFYNDTFYLAMDWDASHLGPTIHEGDYFDITLPGNMRFPAGTTARDFDLKDGDGNVIATAHVDPGPRDIGGTLRVTFTDNVESKYDVKGTIYLAAKFERSLITTGQSNTFSITINSDVAGSSQTADIGVIVTGPKVLVDEHVGKWGEAVDGDPNVAEWVVRINHAKATLTNAVFSDTLGSSGESYIPGSFRLQRVEFDPYGNVVTATNVPDDELASMLSFSADGSSFTIDFGTIEGQQYYLRYRSTYTPTTTLRNAATISSNEVNKTFRGRYISADSGGTGGGSLASRIKIIKVDEDDVTTVLADAVFKVTAPDGSTFTLTTGPDGTVTSDILTQGTYQVEEIQAPGGYEIIPGESSFTMEVTPAGGAIRRVKNRKASTIEISVKKVWDDADNQDGIRPASVTVRLLADGADTGQTAVLSEATNWTASFSDLDEYKDGRKVAYTVEELEVEGYATTVTGDAATGYTITNVHEPELTSVEGSKTWDDNDDQDGARPESITIRLLADGEQIDSRTATEADGWSWIFANLPKYKDGREISYSVTEDAVSGYSAEYSGYDITNTHAPGKTSLTVAKAWDDADNQDGIRPASVTVRLLADGADTGQTAVLSEATNWTASFSDLDEYKDGRKVAYTVEELEVEGYATTVTGDAATGYTITNVHEPELTSVEGSKTWDDNDDQDGARPESITIRLLANGTEVASKTVTEADGWSWAFEGLPKYRGGEEISYSITEGAVPGYTATVSGDASSGFAVTNTHAPGRTHVSVAKAWVDGDDRDGARPASVTIRLLADGVDTGRALVLDASNGWTASFTDLDEYKDGRKVAYTVAEDAVEGYATTISGDASSGFIVTNTRTQTPPPPPAVPKAGDAAYAPIPLLLALAGASLILRVCLRRDL